MKEKVFLIAIGAILCLMAALGYLLLPPENAETVQPTAAMTTAPIQPTQTATPTELRAKPIKVTVKGAVYDPGTYTLRVGATVLEAIRAAGGTKIKANLKVLDLYRTLADGETITVKQYTAAEWEEIKKMKIPPEKGNEIPSE